MRTNLTQNGRSTTAGHGQFRWDTYHSTILGDERVRWDYRSLDGVLYSGVALSVEDARRMAEQQSGETIHQ